MDKYSQYRGVAERLGADAVALVPGPNFERLTGHSFHSHERPLLIVIPTTGTPAAIVPNLELRSFDLLGFEGEVFDWRDQDGYADAFTALAAHMPLQKLAVEGQVMRVFVHHALLEANPGLSILDGEREISGLRIHKTEDEVAALREAIRISEAALGDVLAEVRIGMTEKQVEAMLIQALFRNGSDGLAFDPIVAAGDNSARPHASARADYAIQDGDALLFDFGATHGGFMADITRTVFVGHASDAARAVYDTVLRANLKGHEITRPGVTAHDIDDAVTSVLEASPYVDRIRTKTGHGLGRAVHEHPYIMRGNTLVLEPGMVFTNEPGLYDLASFGVRIEDDILVTEDGCVSLTTFPKDLTVVG
ncbi:M24 family metallopeptidase [Pseudooceanicola spongiae]|jgi:Xaa-Pro dipeptidase|uniref:M24 family metallopeptidase n=1 Tax=Pseudooceanicola spongiae TaxID=2613965 RepID=A0A7L9WN71_9RHOB|nr:Xaa-Pro peptidase family protein [Pseudooceanicola spongiae]QOL81373.1 M24 family metallopeptidase [Pseudooceanicola spongiae]